MLVSPCINWHLAWASARGLRDVAPCPGVQQRVVGAALLDVGGCSSWLLLARGLRCCVLGAGRGWSRGAVCSALAGAQSLAPELLPADGSACMVQSPARRWGDEGGPS